MLYLQMEVGSEQVKVQVLAVLGMTHLAMAMAHQLYLDLALGLALITLEIIRDLRME